MDSREARAWRLYWKATRNLPKHIYEEEEPLQWKRLQEKLRVAQVARAMMGPRG